MRYYLKRDTFMTFLLACFLTTFPGCSADLSQAVGPGSPVAAVAVNVDSSTLLVGHVAQVSITALDTAGHSISVPSVSWTSITPDIATVSSTGAVTAVASGEAVIEGRISGSTGRVELTVVVDPDLAANNFNNGTLGPYTNPWGVDLDFPADPTGSGHGGIARFHYAAVVAPGGVADQNRALDFIYPRRWGQSMYFRGDFYIPVGDIAVGDVLRKLIYWQPHNDYAKYTVNGGLATGRTVVLLTGSDLIVDATYNPEPGTGKNANDVRTVATVATGIEANRWYTLEVHQRMETAIGRADGILQVWLDGKLVFDKDTMTWSDPAWVGNTSNGVPFDASDIYFEHFLVGQQVNGFSSFDEYRYWDNVEFSTRRIGR
jgi:hypothetical protein